MKQKKNRPNYWKKNCSGKTIQCPQRDTRGSRSHFFRLRLHSCPKFFNPDPVIFQIWEFASCSDFGYNHRSNRNLPMFLLKKWPHRLLLLQKLKSDSGSGSGFSQIFDSGSERKTQNPAGFDSGTPYPIPPLHDTTEANHSPFSAATGLSAKIPRFAKKIL